MKLKFLNLQLIVLLLFSIFNLFYNFLGESFPDNSLLITNSSENINIVSYYFFSAISYTSFFTGSWIIFALGVCYLIYILLLSTRESLVDNFIPLLVLIFLFSFFYTLLPNFIGQGLLLLSSNYLNGYILFGSMIISFSLIVYLCQNEMFVSGFLNYYHYLRDFIFKTSNKLYYSSFKLFIFKKKFKIALKPHTVESKVTSLLKSGPEFKKSSVSSTKSTEVDCIKNKKEPVTSFLKDVHCEEDKTEKKQEFDIKADDKSPEIYKVPIGRTSFFECDTLIDCISGHGQHGTISNPDQDYFNYIQSNIEDKLSEFKVEAKIVNVLKGPVVDTFELELGPAVKVSKVMGLSDDIGLALNGAPIRIVYPMKGRSTIGIEVPRNPRDIIFLDEVLRSEHFNSSRYRLPVAMGRDAFGEVSVVDLASMPHMLVAGATGAGKSVFINTLLVSLIIKMSPQQMKLLLIDPKQLELALYQDLPHLMLPVITEAKSASIALLWAVQEMERRYSILKEMGVKNIEGFNKKISNSPSASLARLNHFYQDHEDSGYELPYLVIIIDEFADLILTKSGKEIEDNVNRLAAKARAAGIHIVLATQRPSTDVVTGVIKANFPTRVAFRVTTATDSRVILDQLGAEKLLGKGDMLYKHGVDVMRVHSSYVEEEEIEQLVNKLSTIPAQFNSNAMNFLENVDEEMDSEVTVSYGAPKATGDQLYDDAVQIVIDQGSASASMLQRRLRVGYNRAANLIEEMEKNGIVGPQQGSKPREILLGRGE